ncbi:MAG TPA: NADP-dependent oxidoreductase [Alphaproteobacteria bacterium]|nr:NADP-dependent oxidoreductase [Alphaproteobacteria bacterium]
MHTMTAICYERFGGPEVLELREAAKPSPLPGQVLVAVKAASVIPADWKLRAGHLQHLFVVTFPKIPGRDGAGVVEAVGDGVEGVAVGDEVAFVTQHTEQGSHAQYAVANAASVVAKPAGLSFIEAAALMHAGVCAWIALEETAGLTAGQGTGNRVLIHGGAGAIGGMAVQLAHHRGAFVAATCSARNADFVRALGADEAIAYDEVDFAAALEPVDIVLDLIGGAVHRRSYPVLKRGGTLVYLIAEPIEDRSAEFGVRTVLAPIHDDRAALEAVVRLAGEGAWRPLVSAVMPLAEGAEAQRLLESGANSRGRIVLTVS